MAQDDPASPWSLQSAGIGGKAITLAMPFAYKAVVDAMSGERALWTAALMLVVAYAGARFGGVLADNLRNALFEKVGQNAARRLAARVFRHVHSLSLRFHLERRTGSLTKIVERGTKSIDLMLYFLLFNIAPTVIAHCNLHHLLHAARAWSGRRW
jgi:ATP-binding cassette subfamily B protein